MKVLLVITNIDGFHEIPYSFGLSSVDSYVKSKGHESKIFGIRNEDDYVLFEEELKRFKPNVVGFTVVSSQVPYVKKAVKRVKEVNDETFIVCGGVHPTLHPDSLLEMEELGGVFMGESEIEFGQFLEKLEKNLDYKKVNNFAFKENNKIIRNPISPLLRNLDILPCPSKDNFFEEQIKKNGYAPFFFSRGCPFLCSYCSNVSLAKVYGNSKNTTRYRSVDSCIQELTDASERFEFDSIFIMDDTFGINRRWRKEFCEKYKKYINKKFICLLRVNIVDEEFIKLLKGAGCYRIQFGVESGNEYIRNTVMARNITNEQLVSAFNFCRIHGLETCALNIIGVPGETEEMIWDTVKLNRQIKPTDSGVNIFYPYKGTPLGDQCFTDGLVDQKLYDTFSNERRDSVLKYSSEHKSRLLYFHKNWSNLVYPMDMKKRTLSILRNHTVIYNTLRKIKKAVTS